MFNTKREPDYVISDHAFKRAKQRSGYDPKTILELWWAAREHGNWADDDSYVEHAGLKFVLKGTTVTTIIPANGTPSTPVVKLTPKVHTYRLNDKGATKIAIPKDARLLGIDVEDSEFVVGFIHKGGPKHERIFMSVAPGDECSYVSDARFIGVIDKSYVFDMGFTKVDVQ